MESPAAKIKEGVQSAVSKVKETTAGTVEYVQGKVSEDDIKEIAEKGREIAEDGAKKTKEVARHLWTIQSVKNAAAGAAVGIVVGGVVGTFFGGIFLCAKIGFVIGAIYGFVKK